MAKIRLTESRLKNMINESVKKVLREFVSGEEDYGDTYNDYQLKNETNKQLDSIVRDLHTICQYYDMVKSNYEKDPSNMQNKSIYYLVGTVNNYLSKYSNSIHSEKLKMHLATMRAEICPALNKLSNMQLPRSLSNIQGAAYRALEKILKQSGDYAKLQ